MFQFVYNGWLTVETFFFLSGLIMVFCTLPILIRKKGRFNYTAFLVHRIIRIMPAYTAAISMNILLPLIIHGPIMLAKGNEFIGQPCEKYWWASFLFINNWFDMSDVVSRLVMQSI